MGEGEEDFELIILSDSLETLPLQEIGTEDIGEGDDVFGGDTNPFMVACFDCCGALIPLIQLLSLFLLELLGGFSITG